MTNSSNRVRQPGTARRWGRPPGGQPGGQGGAPGGSVTPAVAVTSGTLGRGGPLALALLLLLEQGALVAARLRRAGGIAGLDHPVLGDLVHVRQRVDHRQEDAAAGRGGA